MSQIILPGDPPVCVELSQSRRYKRLSLRVERVGGRVLLTSPSRVRNAQLRDFVTDKESWIRKQLNQKLPQVVVGVGQSVPLAGRDHRIVTGTGRKVEISDGLIEVPAGPSSGARVAAVFKTLARERLAQAATKYALRLGRDYTRLTLRDTRSRWGSCSDSATLNFSWRLIMAPPDVLEYVAAHEVAHLMEMNHSPRFWAHVRALMPEYETQRAWLRREGWTLHRYCFKASGDGERGGIQEPTPWN